MTMKAVIATFFCLYFVSLCFSQNETVNQETKKYFVITASTKSYESALESANSIAKSMKLKLDLRGLQENEENDGLTWDGAECQENGWEPPCYVARGRYDDGGYVSIEWSNAFQGFSKGYYIVVVASYSDNNDKLKATLLSAKEHVPSAYSKSSNVYMGCMH